MRNQIVNCPSCGKPLQVTELTCSTCDLRLHGHFERGCKFCSLDPEQRQLLNVFLSSRGVVRDMEKALGLSYPTVRARIDTLLNTLGYTSTKVEAETREEKAARRRDIIERLSTGEITAEEAAAELKELAK